MSLKHRILPEQIKRHYHFVNVGPIDVECVSIEDNDEGGEEITIYFKNQTLDVWGWVLNPQSRDPQYPCHWSLLEDQVPVEDELQYAQ